MCICLSLAGVSLVNYTTFYTATANIDEYQYISYLLDVLGNRLYNLLVLYIPFTLILLNITGYFPRRAMISAVCTVVLFSLMFTTLKLLLQSQEYDFEQFIMAISSNTLGGFFMGFFVGILLYYRHNDIINLQKTFYRIGVTFLAFIFVLTGFLALNSYKVSLYFINDIREWQGVSFNYIINESEILEHVNVDKRIKIGINADLIAVIPDDEGSKPSLGMMHGSGDFNYITKNIKLKKYLVYNAARTGNLQEQKSQKCLLSYVEVDDELFNKSLPDLLMTTRNSKDRKEIATIFLAPNKNQKINNIPIFNETDSFMFDTESAKYFLHLSKDTMINGPKYDQWFDEVKSVKQINEKSYCKTKMPNYKQVHKKYGIKYQLAGQHYQDDSYDGKIVITQNNFDGIIVSTGTFSAENLDLKPISISEIDITANKGKVRIGNERDIDVSRNTYISAERAHLDLHRIDNESVVWSGRANEMVINGSSYTKSYLETIPISIISAIISGIFGGLSGWIASSFRIRGT